MIKKLLVAVDGSGHSMKAVDFAASIAAAMNAKLIVLYVLKTHELPKGLANYANIEHIQGGDEAVLQKAASALVDEAKERAATNGVGDITGEVIDGPVARTVIARAAHHDVDMIVIGSRGMGNIEATLRGGVSHRVELLATCPVLTVR
ncbi:MAG: universal stress protein [Proteobacteria bacterium]|nr:universal stress protein [Pseudomonadota bacterium]